MENGNSMAMRIDMPSGGMAAPPGPSVDMPSGEMPGEELSAFTPATGEMPRGGMGAPAGGVLAGLMAGLEATALSDMPGGGMGAIGTAAASEPGIEINGSWTLLLTSSVFKQEGSR